MTKEEKITAEKKRYWLKLDKNFLKSTHIKVIKNMPNGKDYIIFYLALMLESVETIGHLRFSELVPYNEQMLASITDTNVDIVRSAVKLFEELGLMEMLDDGTIYMTQVAQMTGKESDSASRVRQYRLRQKEMLVLQCNDDVTNCNDNKEKEKQEEKQSTEYKEDKQKEQNKGVSVSETTLNLFDDLMKRHEIEDDSITNILVNYLESGMSLEVVKNGLMIPYDRNVIGFNFELDESPIENPLAYGLKILENWFEFGVKTIEDVKKYNKLNKNLDKMIGAS